MSCSKNCGKDCGKNHCGACCGGACHSLTLVPAEYALLQTFAVTPFLPVAASWNLKTPIYLEDSEFSQEEYSWAVQALALKGLVRIDYDIPLGKFDYSAYRSYPMHGSMALTAAGQDIVEQLEIQDIMPIDKSERMN